MSLQQKLTNSITEKFNNARIKKTGVYAPRPGYFYIREIFLKEVAPFGEVLMAHVNWKSDLSNHFLEDVIFEIALTNLHADRSETFKNWKPEDLVGKTIHVYNAVVLEKSFNGEMKKVLSCQWQLIAKEPEFLNTRLAAIQVFFQGSSNGKEAYENLVNTAVYDVLEALDYEAQYGHRDDYTEGFDDNDAPDAPIDEPNE